MGSFATLIPLFIFLIFSLCAALVVRKRSAKSAENNFIKSYFIGNRSLGAFVLAMTTIATYGSVSSFVGGPGMAWKIGFGWVYMASVQVTALFLLYGIMGKKMALVSRKLGAVTVVDVIRERYNSNALAMISAIIIVVFFMATMVAQFVGGAKLFEAVTGYSYTTGLLLFGVAAILFTAIGGFRGVAITDALCGIAMLIGVFVLAFGIFNEGGGYIAVMDTLLSQHPEFFDPFSGGNMPAGLYFTQWLLVGILTLCLPQSVVRCMSFKNTESLHQAMIMGTVIIGAMMIGITSLGVFAAAVMPGGVESYGGSIDSIIPYAIAHLLPSWLSGLAIIGPIAASISTVSSLLIAAASALIKDIYLHKKAEQHKALDDKKVRILSQCVTFLLGIMVFVLAIVPPSVIWKINMFAFGGLETAFTAVLIAGLFWKRANKTGALWSMGLGTFAYCLSMALGFKVCDLHQIVIGLTVSVLGMVIGSLVASSEKSPSYKVFFPTEECETK